MRKRYPSDITRKQFGVIEKHGTRQKLKKSLTDKSVLENRKLKVDISGDKKFFNQLVKLGANVETVEVYLHPRRSGGESDWIFNNGRTPMLWASLYCNTDIGRNTLLYMILADRKAGVVHAIKQLPNVYTESHINQKNQQGITITPLMLAISYYPNFNYEYWRRL